MPMRRTPHLRSQGIGAIACLACGLTLITATGCGPTPQPTASAQATSEIRGDPIRPPAAPQAESVEAKAAAAAMPTPPGTVPATMAQATLSQGGVQAGTPEAPMQIGFDKLASFNYDVPDGPAPTNAVETAAAPSQIPQAVRDLDQKFVTLKGFMLPLKVESGLVTELLIMRDQSMCCFGTVPKINEWVSVKMTGKGVKPIMDQAVTMEGRLHVGEIRENGYLVGIYLIDGKRVIGPQDL